MPQGLVRLGEKLMGWRRGEEWEGWTRTRSARKTAGRSLFTARYRALSWAKGVEVDGDGALVTTDD
jgi:hypothetical protein